MVVVWPVVFAVSKLNCAAYIVVPGSWLQVAGVQESTREYANIDSALNSAER